MREEREEEKEEEEEEEEVDSWSRGQGAAQEETPRGRP